MPRFSIKYNEVLKKILIEFIEKIMALHFEYHFFINHVYDLFLLFLSQGESP